MNLLRRRAATFGSNFAQNFTKRVQPRHFPFQSSSRFSSRSSGKRSLGSGLFAGICILGGSCGLYVTCSASESDCNACSNASSVESVGENGCPTHIPTRSNPKPNKPDPSSLPTYTIAEVQDGSHHPGRVWVTLKGGVYDVTTFLDAHPGGPHRIMMVDGQDLSAFWAVYRLHDRKHIRELLEDYRIGNLSPKDAKIMEAQSTFHDAYAEDPDRPKRDQLRIPTEHPWNSEPSLGALTDDFFTPNDLFFVRNHNPVPDIDEEEWVLEVEGNESCGMKSRTFTLNELKTKFPRHEVISALQCAGNRQEDFVTKDRPLYVAPHWRGSAIGNAKWVGVKVRDILKACGLDVDAMALGTKDFPKVKMVNFIAEDTDETGVPYGGVLPIEKVVDPFGDAILAYTMNGETLPRDHGFPVRLLAPGHAGCRNVKWVSQIAVSEQPSELDSGSKLDRHFAPDVSFKGNIRTETDLRLDQGPVIQTLPVQSIISHPQPRSVLSAANGRGKIEVKGVAWSGGGRGICRVEVSVDGGKSFTAAELYRGPNQTKEEPVPCERATCSMTSPPQSGQGHRWAWTQFSKEVELNEEQKEKLSKGETVELEVVARAVDGDFNVQPEHMSQSWNVLGICVNHWPRSPVTLDPSVKQGEAPAPPAPPAAGSWDWNDTKQCWEKPPVFKTTHSE